MPKRILLADDSITIQKVVELTFSDGDYEVVAVNNGAKAIQKLSEMRPDIILSDIIMPEKNGYEVCEYVKSHPEFRAIPVILLTGTFEPFDPDRADKAGCDAVVTKPFESQSLIHKVEELVQQSRQSAAPAATPPAPPETEPWGEAPAAEPAPSAFSALPEEPFGSGPSTESNDLVAAETAPSASPSTEMPLGGSEQFSGETRAFPRPSFGDFQRPSEESMPPPPPPPTAAEPSPWDEPPQYSGETRAFPRMSFDEMQGMAQESAPPPETEPAPPPIPHEAPFETAEAEAFSSETRAFPRMSFEEMRRMAEEPAAPPPPPAPVPPSPWEEPPEYSGETRALPKISFEEMQRMATESALPPPAAPEPEPPQAWGEPEQTPEPAFSAAAPAAASQWGEEPEAPRQETAEEPTLPPLWETEAPRATEPEPAPAFDQPEPAWAPSPAVPPAEAGAGAATVSGELTDEQIDRIARRVVQLMSDSVVRNIAWEVIPDLAEIVVKERIRQLESE